MRCLVFLVFLICSSVHAQVEDAWVYFKDKSESETYFASPEMMLSTKALERRLKQRIPLDLYDVPITPRYISEIRNSASVEILAASKWLNAVHVRGELLTLQGLKDFSFVATIQFLNKSLQEKNYSVSKIKGQSKFEEIQELPYGFASSQVKMLQLEALHNEGFLGEGITIAVMDAGFPGVNFFEQFDSIRINKQIKGGYNFVDRNSNFYSRHSHGTSVLSTMAGYVSDSLIGTAPKSDYYLFITEAAEFEHPLEESLWVEAAERADSLGVDILNTSLGYSVFDNSNHNYGYSDLNGNTAFISRGAEIASSRGMVVVNSAGNEGNKSWKYITPPADATSVLTVGAVDRNENLTGFSSVGPTSDGRIKPDVVAQGEGVVVVRGNGTLGYASGTSFSSPILAGAIASLWGSLPEMTSTEISDYVKQSSSFSQSPNDFYGYGIPNFKAIYENATTLEQIEGLAMYPNPTNGPFFIELPSSQLPRTLKVFSIFGEKLVEKTIIEEQTFLNFEILKTGVYIFELEGTNSVKIIKN